MLFNVLNKDFDNSKIDNIIKSFCTREEAIKVFFCNASNEEKFAHELNNFSVKEKILARNYYLALLHHLGRSEYFYSFSFLLSTSTRFSTASNFAYSLQDIKKNPIIIFGWVPSQYKGVLSVPNLRKLKQTLDLEKVGLPIYKRSFFPKQNEITLIGGLLPHYLLGYLDSEHEDKIFEINPALFKVVINEWDGVELPVDQSSFKEKIQHTSFGKYFTFNPHCVTFSQNEV